MKLLTTPGTHQALTTKLSMSGILVLKPQYGTRRTRGGVDIDDLVNDLKFRKRHLGKDSTISVLPNGSLALARKNKVAKRVPQQRSVKLPPKERGLNKSKIKNLIAAMVNTMRQEFTNPFLCFYTVSFPPCVNERMAKRLLNIMLTRLRQEKKIWAYLWIMEFQKNNTPHFHILIPGRLNVRYVNKIVAATLCNMVRKKELDWNLSAAKRYNGVDIAGRKVNKKKEVTNFANPQLSKILSWYITKYITKNDSKSTSQLWHCSREFGNLCVGVACTTDEAKDFMTMVEPTPLEGKYFNFYRWAGGAPKKICEYLARVNLSILQCLLVIKNREVLGSKEKISIDLN